MNLASMMHQTLTYWGPGQNDGFTASFDAVTPRQLACRWEDKQVKYRNKEGEEEISQAVIYTSEALEVGGYVALRDAGTVTGTDPHSSGAVEVRHLGASPSLQPSTTLYKYMIGGRVTR